MKTPTAPGPLMVIGGAEDKTGRCAILREFVRLAGGARARIVVLTVASEYPAEVGAEYAEVLARLGAGQVRPLDVRRREEACAEGLVEAIGAATGVFFTGGDQLRIANLLGGTATDRALRRHEGGLVLAGTSAGASMMSGTMIVEGRSEGSPRLGDARIGPGMDFLHGTIIDQHFGARGRMGRLLSALAQYPHQLGIGIDEDTAMVVRGERFEVIGSGAVTVLDAGAASHNDMLERREGECLALCGVALHVLTAGLGFDLAARVPILPRRTTLKKKTENNRHADR
ncbi:MAG: cyanophycinase [Gemmataceae bacterium]|nr:cyanophycinase [Gemmataceae bacterium]